MPNDLKPADEKYLDMLVADAKYASRAEALEAAIAALREKHGDAPNALPATGDFDTIALTPEECENLRRQALAKNDGAKSSGYTIPERQ